MNRSLLLLFVCTLLLASCSVTKTLPEVNRLRPYDKEAHYLHPNLGLYHLSADSSRLFIEVESSEFLLSRLDPTQPFSWKVGLEVRIRTDRDSIVFMDAWQLDLSDKQKGKVILSKDVKVGYGDDFHLYAIVKDLSRNVSEKKLMRFDKSQKLTPNSFLLKDSNGHPLIDNAVVKDSTYSVECATCGSKPLRYYNSSTKVPLPPFPHSPNSRAVPSLQDAGYSNLVSLSDLSFNLRDLWSYIGPANDSDGTGIFVRETSPSYPNIEHFSTMSTSTRYVATRKEYMRIMESKDQHQALDDFWLRCAGTTDRAKSMIKMYYRRVEEANTYFTDYHEGWKTDRGLIHILYGNPNRVYQKRKEEVWIYGASDDPSAPVFRFERKFNKVVGHYYELQRQSGYKADWDSIIQAWKNGKIYTG